MPNKHKMAHKKIFLLGLIAAVAIFFVEYVIFSLFLGEGMYDTTNYQGTYGITSSGTCYYNEDYDDLQEYSQNFTFQANISHYNDFDKNCELAKKMESQNTNNSFNKTQFLEEDTDKPHILPNFLFNYRFYGLFLIVTLTALFFRILFLKYIFSKANTITNNSINYFMDPSNEIDDDALKKLINFNKQIIDGHYKRAFNSYKSLKKTMKSQ